MKPSLKVVPMPARCGDVTAMLRQLADEIDAGDYEEDVSVLTVICGDRFDVRGFGRVSGMEAVGYFHLAADHLTKAVLDEIKDD